MGSGELNGDPGNSLGDKGCYAPNDRGLRLLDFANYFVSHKLNLLLVCSRPLETFVSHCGRFKSKIDYILLSNCLHDSIVSCKTFEQTIENTSDHLPVQLKINYNNSCTALSFDNCSEMDKVDGQIVALKLFQHFTLLRSQTNWKI